MTPRQPAPPQAPPPDATGATGAEPRASSGAADTSLDALVAAVDAIVGRLPDERDETALHDDLATVDRQVRRLHAHCDRVAAALNRRRAARLRDRGEARPAERATRQTVDELRATLQWSPGRAKAAITTTSSLATLPDTRQALTAGDVSSRHAAVLADTLRHLTGTTRRDAERTLLDAAVTQDPVSFGRTCRRLLSQLDPDAADRDHQRRRARRFCRTWTDEQGFTRISGAWTGIDAETLLTSIDAFRTLDRPGERPRTPEQRTADAVAGMARAALDHGVDTTSHGSRPHVLIVRRVERDGTSRDDGIWTGPLPRDEADRTATDASVAAIELDADGGVVRSGRARPAVPAHVWRGLVARDGGCTFPGCTAPPGWCDAAHRDVRYAQGGGNTLDDYALACRTDHRTIDRLRLTGRLIEGRIVWFRPDGTRYQGRDGPDPP